MQEGRPVGEVEARGRLQLRQGLPAVAVDDRRHAHGGVAAGAVALATRRSKLRFVPERICDW